MNDLAELLARHPLPRRDGGKEEHGTVLVVGGSPECPGAVLLAATAALRLGAGRTQVAVHPAAATPLAVQRPELLVLPFDGSIGRGLRARLAQADAVLLGVGCAELDVGTVLELAEAASAPVVLDAGALPAAPKLPEGRLAVAAPNVAEAQALLASEEEDEVALARALAARLGVPVAVRGPATAVVEHTEAWRFDEAPSGLGTPGSGDVFAGVLAALLAAGVAPAGALGWAVRLHADAGARCAGSMPVGYLASEVADQLPLALGALR